MKPCVPFLLLLLASSAQATYSTGSNPPDFTCNTTRPDLHGTSWNLDSHLGKVVMINFGAVWCGPCNAEFPYLQSAYEEQYDPSVFELVHIDVDNEPASYLNNHWITNYGVTFPLLMGCGSLFGAWGGGSIPHTVVLDPDGIVRGNWVGFSTGDIPVIQGVIENWLPALAPVLSVESVQLVSGDDGDNRAEAGENLQLVIRVHNQADALDAMSVSGTLVSADPLLVTDGVPVVFPPIPGGSSADGQATFSLAVDPLSPVYHGELVLQLTVSYEGSGGSVVLPVSFTLPVGWPDWLVVDSDGSLDDNEAWIDAAFEALDWPFDRVGPADGPIDASTLAPYPRVFWAGGSDTGDVGVSEAAALAAYLDGGGRLLLSSQHALNNGANSSFFAEYLKVGLAENLGVTRFLMQGAAGDPFFDALQLVITGSGGAGNNLAPDRLDVLAGGTPVLSWTQGTGGVAGVAVAEQAYRAVFLGFAAEACRIHGSYPLSVNLAGLLQRAEAFLSVPSNVTTGPIPVTFRVDMNCWYPAAYAGGVALSGAGPLLGDWTDGFLPLVDPDLDGVYEGELVVPAGSPFLMEYRFQSSPNGLVWITEPGLPGHRSLQLEDGSGPVILAPVAFDDGLCAPQVRIQYLGAGLLGLEWDAVVDALGYRVHREDEPGFQPQPANQLMETQSTSITVPAGPGRGCFKVVAVR